MTVGGSAGRTPGATSKVEFARGVVKDAVEQLVSQLRAGRSDGLREYLRVMARFHRYSFNNIMLILAQRPDATRVAGFRAWLSMGRHVKRGEKGIVIIAPMRLRARDSDNEDEPESDGEPKRITRFRAVHVFDIDQTDGDPPPEMETVRGEPGQALQRLESAIVASGIAVETVESLGGALGVSRGGLIQAISGLSAAERFHVLSHEWAHETLHKDRAGLDRPSKTVRETEADAVAFVVCHAVGLETGSAVSDYIAMYDGDEKTLMASLDRVQQAAAMMIDAILGEHAVQQPCAETTRVADAMTRAATDRRVRGR